MDFEQLRIFMILAEEGTYLGAATRLSTSRSRVRRKVEQLENAAEIPLILRDRGILRPTPAGEVLVRRGRALLDDADRLISHVREIGTVPTGKLEISMPTGPPSPGWERIRQLLQTRFPELQIELFFDENPAKLLPERAEIAMTYEDDLPRGCSVIEIGEYPMRLFVSARYLAAHGSPDSLEDLLQHRVAMWRSPNGPANQILLKNGRTLKITPHFVTDDPALLYRLSIEGAFITYLPEFPDLTDPSLKILFQDEIVGTVRERLAIPDILADLPRIKALVELTQQVVLPRVI